MANAKKKSRKMQGVVKQLKSARSRMKVFVTFYSFDI